MFRFQQFTVHQQLCAMKVGTDGVLLGAWARGGQRILDVGCGTGLIALMMAQRYKEAQVIGIDIDEGAVLQSLNNIAASPFKNRIGILHQSVQDFSMLSERQGLYDAVVSNPPFFVDSLKAPDKQRNAARHTDKLTYAELMQATYKLLADNGEFSVVVPFDYRHRMEDEAIFAGFFPSRVCAIRTVSHKPPRRFLLAFRKHPCLCQQEELTIGDEAYMELTRDFYLPPAKHQ
ncbi:MAG: methyltransferase [Prevotella sp.]|nr:methyltransferase [Prevotella sp.]